MEETVICQKIYQCPGFIVSSKFINNQLIHPTLNDIYKFPSMSMANVHHNKTEKNIIQYQDQESECDYLRLRSHINEFFFKASR